MKAERFFAPLSLLFVASFAIAQLVSASGREVAAVVVGRFSAARPGTLPPGWRERTFSRITRTRYTIVHVGDRTVLEADSRNSASALTFAVRIDPAATPYVNWSWRIDGVVPRGGWGTRSGDDFPARLFVMFKEDRVHRAWWSISPAGGAFAGRALNYVWANQGDRERMARSPATDSVVMIAVEAGGDRAGTWVDERRNVVDDFKRAFGGAPTTIRGVAVMTDTDDTHTARTTWYGDIRFADRPME